MASSSAIAVPRPVVSHLDAMQAALFRCFREHYQKRDRLRLVLDYRKKHLDLLLRGGEEEREQFDTSPNPLPERGGEGTRGEAGRGGLRAGQNASGQGLRGDSGQP